MRLHMPTIDAPALMSAQDFSAALSDLIRVVQFRDRDRACCYDLSVTQCYALERVVHSGGLTVNELSAALYLDKSTASRVANSLVEKGVLERRGDAADGRIVRLVATAAGASTCARIEADLAAEYADLLSDFEPEVQAASAEVLRRLASAFARRVDVSNGRCCAVPVPATGGGE
jgi:DNA-binding MarR family transcriptional regulator